MHERVITVPNGLSSSQPTIIEGEGALGCAVAENCNTILDTDGHDLPNGPQYITFRNFKITGQNHSTGASCIRFADAGTPINSGIIIDNVEMAYCWQHGIFTTSDLNNLTVRNFSINHTNAGGGTDTTNAGHGAYLEGDNTLIETGTVHDIAGTVSLGIQIFDSAKGGSVANAIVRSVAFYNIPNNDGLVVAGPNSTVYNNTFTKTLRGYTHYGGSSARGCNTGAKFYNNTITGTAIAITIGIFASGCDNLTAELSNNIVIGNTDSLDLEHGWTNSGTNNAGDMQTNWDVNSSAQGGTCGASCGTSPVTLAAITDVTVSTSNFHLKSGTNSAVDAGVTLATVTTDKDGIKRPQGSGPDIGAYERSGSGTTQLAAPTNLRVS
jgi:hypothetical protein